MSFFDEDDEPVRTTARTRQQRAARPRPRRGSPAGGRSGPDSQALLVRRLGALVGIIVVVLVLGLLVHSCSTSRHKDALQTYNQQVNNLATESAGIGSQFFRQLDQAQNESPNDLQQAISSLKVQAGEQLSQAQNLSTPDEMKAAQQSLLISLEFRRDALGAIAGDIRTALGDQGSAADAAIKRIAGNMQAFNASDVLYSQRVVPFIKQALHGRRARADHRRVAVPARHRVAEPAVRGHQVRPVAQHRRRHAEQPAHGPGPPRHRPRAARRTATRRSSAGRDQPARPTSPARRSRCPSPTRATTTSSTSRSR